MSNNSHFVVRVTERALIAGLLAIVVLVVDGCAVTKLIGYARRPDFPVFDDGQQIGLAGLNGAVSVAQRSDGLWRINADSEADGMRVLGYLQAADRLAQMDILRHLARGEIAQLIGNVPFGDKSSLDVDRTNRFLGFSEHAQIILDSAVPEERELIDAYVSGVNAWINTGPLPLEHRLLGIDQIRPWTAHDSAVVFRMLMWGLSSNANREIRRLLLACRIGIDGMQRVWPTDILFAGAALPAENQRDQEYPMFPGVVSEVAEALPGLCPGTPNRESNEARRLDSRQVTRQVIAMPWVETLVDGISASNNWVISGEHTRSGAPLLGTDPHLPHMNPPILWGVELYTPAGRIAGFTFPGLHRIVFGHNGRVAWGATTNHADRQDLVVVKPAGEAHYWKNGVATPYDIRRATFEVAGGEVVEQAVRFTVDGPLLNDLDPFVAEYGPLVALRRVDISTGRDLNAARGMNLAQDVPQFVEALQLMDTGCSSWVAADTDGNIAFGSPCRIPVRDGWMGTFPIPGWVNGYDWNGVYDKSELPASLNPQRGWLATANNRIIPPERFPSAYNNDPSAPFRFQRIGESIQDNVGTIDLKWSNSLHQDVHNRIWPQVGADPETGLCGSWKPESPEVAVVEQILCDWDGEMSAESTAATVYVLLTHAVLDAAAADEFPDGRDDPVWKYVQTLSQFEAAASSIWLRDSDDPIWDDLRTAGLESKADTVRVALAAAIPAGRDLWGGTPEEWAWGTVRPFVLRHMFAPNDGILGNLVNAAPVPGAGGASTVFKNQFVRSDRERMNPQIGPPVRLTVDLADPWAAQYSMAGGQSGWPKSPHYADLLTDWRNGTTRSLTPDPQPTDIQMKFVPTSEGTQQPTGVQQ